MTSYCHNRRRIIKNGIIATSGFALSPLFSGLALNNVFATNNELPTKKIPLIPTKDRATGLELLKLPSGFSYTSYGWTGDLMSDGTRTPDRHDGMAVIDYDKHTDTLILMRNHERGEVEDVVIGAGNAPIYDGFSHSYTGVDSIGGGVTSLMYRNSEFISSQAVLGGTIYNCAGGATPWGSWLTCEEYVVSRIDTTHESKSGATRREHGYVFEVPSPRLGSASAKPIIDMGKMKHEAVAVDPVTGIVYLTEDNKSHSGFYRFIPRDRSHKVGSLEEGGELQMMKVVSVNNANLTSPTLGDVYHVEWVTIDQPNMDPDSGQSGPYLQGMKLGAAKFSRGEGCWYHQDDIYIVDTTGGAAGKGVVWVYSPLNTKNKQTEGELVALFVSPDQTTANNPDNITISPRNGIVVCEDGGSFTNQYGEIVGSRLLSIDNNGSANVFAENNVIIESFIRDKPFIDKQDYRHQEFCGACFDPKGEILFVNIQTPGITFAIKGPWPDLGL